MKIQFPKLRQTYDYDCGAKVTQAILLYYGIDVDEKVVMKIAKTKRSGTKPSGIIRALKHYGLNARGEKMSISKIKKYLDQERPVIIALQAWTDKEDINWEEDWSDGHYVIAIGYDENNIYFEDTASILRTYLTHKELKKRWHDKDSSGRKYVNFGIVAYGKKPVFSFSKLKHMD